MTTFVIDAQVAVDLAAGGARIPPEHSLTAPTLLRSQALALVDELVHSGHTASSGREYADCQVRQRFSRRSRAVAHQDQRCDAGVRCHRPEQLRAVRSTDERARASVYWATVDDAGATGGFFDDSEPLPW
jgi:hypothetical protein